jgi:hypothetical protein
MRNWTDDNENTPCRAEVDWEDVQALCEHLSMPCERVISLGNAANSDRFESRILDGRLSAGIGHVRRRCYAKS